MLFTIRQCILCALFASHFNILKGMIEGGYKQPSQASAVINPIEHKNVTAMFTLLSLLINGTKVAFFFFTQREKYLFAQCGRLSQALPPSRKFRVARNRSSQDFQQWFAAVPIDWPRFTRLRSRRRSVCGGVASGRARRNSFLVRLLRGTGGPGLFFMNELNTSDK